MKIYHENPVFETRKLIEEKAKYQKVMLLYDDSVSNFQVQEIYQSIKDLCVYNQSEISSLDKNEIYNGYKLIIYYCSADGFLKCDFDKSEFVNIFLPTGCEYLPFFLTNESRLDLNNNIILFQNKIDFLMMASVCFNEFYQYFKNTISGQGQFENIAIISQGITTNNLFDYLNKMEKNTYFLDIDILKKHNITYKSIILVDLVLVDAIILLLTSIKTNNYTIVDVYKSGKEDMEMIDKFYKLYFNNSFKNIVTLNFNCLYNYCLKTKQKIKQLISLYNVDLQEVEEIIDKVKLYLKKDNDVGSYLYLYNIFNV